MNDDGRLQDILEYGELALSMAREGMQADVRWRLALERALFIVGEAGAALSSATRARIAQPWQDIIALRHILAHRYDVVTPTRLVEIALSGLPPLLVAIRRDLSRRTRDR